MNSPGHTGSVNKLPCCESLQDKILFKEGYSIVQRVVAFSGTVQIGVLYKEGYSIERYNVQGCS